MPRRCPCLAQSRGIATLGQILFRLPQSVDRPLDPLADCPPVEILLPAEPLERDALNQMILEQLLLVGREPLESRHCRGDGCLKLPLMPTFNSGFRLGSYRRVIRLRGPSIAYS